MALLTSTCMYALIFSILESSGESRSDISQWYMAGVMTMPIIIIEFILMGGIYTNRKFNTIIVIISVVCFFAFYLVVTNQKHQLGNNVPGPLHGRSSSN